MGLQILILVRNFNINNDPKNESPQNLEQLKSTVEEWASDPVKVTAEGELKELIGDWSVWIDGEFENLRSQK